MSVILRLITILCLALPATVPAAAADKSGAGTNSANEVPLVIFNRTVVVFRSDFLGVAPHPRAARAKATVEDALSRGGEHNVAVRDNPEGQLVMMGDTLAFVVTAGDVDPLRQETPEQVAAQAAHNLEQVIAETNEARNLKAMLRGPRGRLRRPRPLCCCYGDSAGCAPASRVSSR